MHKHKLQNDLFLKCIGGTQDAQQKKVTKKDPLQHGTGNNCEPEVPLKGGDSSDIPSTSVDTDPVWVKRNDDKASSQPTKDLVRSESNQSEGNISSGKDGSDDSEGDGENESELEVITIGINACNL